MKRGKVKCWRLDLFLLFSIHNISIFLASLLPYITVFTIHLFALLYLIIRLHCLKNFFCNQLLLNNINLHASALVFTCLRSWNLIFHLRSFKILLCYQKLFQISICMLLLWRFGSNWLLAAHFSSFPRTEQLPVCSSVLLYLRSNLCTTVLLKEILDTRLGKRQFFTLLLTLWVIRAVKNFTFFRVFM